MMSSVPGVIQHDVFNPDLVAAAHHYSTRYHIFQFAHISREVVRELENVMERAVILCPHDTINVECLPKKMQMLAGEEYPVVKEFNLPEIEKRTIIKALDKASWNQSRAAGLLGISRKQLRTKMKNLELLPAAEK